MGRPEYILVDASSVYELLVDHMLREISLRFWDPVAAFKVLLDFVGPLLES